jgi:hypothetical protein
MEAKAIATLVAVIVLIGLGFWGYHEIYSTGHTAGAAEVQSQFDSYRLAQAAVVAKQVSDNSKEAALARATIDRERADYTAKLAASNSAALSFASRLRIAENRSCPGSGAVPGTASGPIALLPGGSNGGNGVDQLSQLLAAANAECTQNADRLDAIVADFTPQLPKASP